MKVLDEGGGSIKTSVGYRRLQQTKWMTLLGTCLVVGSASAFYIMFTVWATKTGRTSPWLNALVVPASMVSISHDIGMVLVSGVLKNVELPSMPSFVPSSKKPSKGAPPVDPSFAADSSASSVYSPDEVVS
jgi:hypothetical protein